MAKHRSHSIEFKRQVAQEFLGGGDAAWLGEGIASMASLAALFAIPVLAATWATARLT